MDFMLIALLAAIVLLMAGFALRSSVALVRRLYLPASAVAGVLAFTVVQLGLHVDGTQTLARGVADEWGTWPSWLIAVVFAGLLLERPSDKSLAESLRRGAASAVMAWILILGQIVVGLLVYLTCVKPLHPEVPASFGQLLEVSWAGGHGSSAAMGDVYRAQGFEHGRDLAFFLATSGLVYGVLSGLVLVNIAIRRGWAQQRTANLAGNGNGSERPIGIARCPKEVLDPLTLQVVFLGLAFGIGYGMQQGFIAISQTIFAGGRAAELVGSLPLFLFTLLGGLGLRMVMQALRLGHLIDETTIQRIVGVAVDFLIVAAIASMRMEAMQQFLLPIVLLLILAAAWCTFCLLFIARRILPERYWFELGLLNYGFATANTPQGLMLLRIVDPDLRSGAAEDYAIAAPLSAPFVGGGILTIVVFPLILQRVNAGVVAGVMALLTVLLYSVGRRLR